MFLIGIYVLGFLFIAGDAHADVLVTAATAIGTVLGASGSAATALGGATMAGGAALGTNAILNARDASKAQKKANQIQFQNQMAAQELQREATKRQMEAERRIEQQTIVGRQRSRRRAPNDFTQTILTPLGGSGDGINSYLGG